MSSLSISRRHTTEPSYQPDGFNIPENYNVLQISEIHAFEESDWSKELYLEGIADQINDFTEFYDVNELWILGDTGSFDDVEKLLEEIDNDLGVKLVAGDEDKKNVTGGYTGWFADRRTSSKQPFDVDVDYQIFDEGFETRIDGLDFQAAHHPKLDQRDDYLDEPDDRDSEFLDRLFSINKDDNVNTLQEMPPRLDPIDVAVFDHSHMPHNRRLPAEELPLMLDRNERIQEGFRMLYGGDPEEETSKVVSGLGGRRYNYQGDNDSLPERSIHLLSVGKEVLNTMHFNADQDEIFEHLAFDRLDDLQMYDVQASRYENQQSGYQLIQERFHNDHIRDSAHETVDQIPPYWEER